MHAAVYTTPTAMPAAHASAAAGVWLPSWHTRDGLEARTSTFSDADDEADEDSDKYARLSVLVSPSKVRYADTAMRREARDTRATELL